MSRRVQRVNDARAYLLHASAWRETSLVVQCFTRDHGLMGLVAKGAKRPHSQLRPILGAFQPLHLSWSGASELKILRRAETAGIVPLTGRSWMSAWYLNELVLRLLPREDPHPVLFDHYCRALNELAQVCQHSARQDDAPSLSGTLRRFEWMLLQETGYGFEGEPPAFDDADVANVWRSRLRERLDTLIDQPLHTRRVMLALHRS
ncbi:MAG TPA: DNA repair protein RecO [Burkholderiaceae bacterium]|nr:DNA repair protein RecO [Burkholderiaceae bacterium]